MESKHNKKLVSLLKEAVISGDTSTVLRLLQDIDRCDLVVNTPIDGDDTTLLHLAANCTNPAIPQLLIAENAGVNNQNGDGFTPLHVAAMNGCEESLRVLMDNGGDPSITDYYGMTPLDYAEEEEQWECLCVLRESLERYQVEEGKEVDQSMCEVFVRMMMDSVLTCNNEEESSHLYDEDVVKEVQTYQSECSLNGLLTSETQEPDTQVSYENDDTIIYMYDEINHSQKEGCKQDTDLSDALMDLTLSSNNVSDDERYTTAYENPNNTFISESSRSVESIFTSVSSELHTCNVKISTDVSSLSNEKLRDKLIELGEEPGPVTMETRGAYLSYLTKILQGVQPSGNRGYKGFKYELALCLNGTIPPPAIPDQEKSAFLEFRVAGQSKLFFNYLLIDPRMLNQSPSSHVVMETDVAEFRNFVEAIFYVGKGKNARSLQHLKDAKDGAKGKVKYMRSEKVKRILDIWKDGVGVISLHLFHNIAAGEAYCRESSIIDCIGIQNLTNVVKGHYHGVMTRWSQSQRRTFGIYLLQKAFKSFLLDTPQQLFQQDV